MGLSLAGRAQRGARSATRPHSCASTIACGRSRRSSLAGMCRTWRFPVAREMTSSVPSTSRSRPLGTSSRTPRPGRRRTAVGGAATGPRARGVGPPPHPGIRPGPSAEGASGSMTAVADRPSVRGADVAWPGGTSCRPQPSARPPVAATPWCGGTRVLLGLVGALKLAGTAYFLFVATAEQGGDPEGVGDWLVGVWSTALAVTFLVAAVRLGRDPRVVRWFGGVLLLDLVFSTVKLDRLRRAGGRPLHGRRPRDPRTPRPDRPPEGLSRLQLPVLADPGVHGDAGGHAGVDRPGGAELGDRQDAVGRLAGLVGQAAALLAEQQDAGPRELGASPAAGLRAGCRRPAAAGPPLAAQATSAATSDGAGRAGSGR